jgi:hypothetical protein
VTLAEGQAQPTSVVAYDNATGTRAIWTQQGSSGSGALSHCYFGAGSPCVPSALESSAHPRQLALTATSLFWFSLEGTGLILSMPVTCGPCAAMAVADTATPDVGGSLAADSQSVFWTDDNPVPNGHLYGSPATGGQLMAVPSSSGAPTAVTVDALAGTVVWADGSTIKQCPNNVAQQCAPTTLVNLAGTSAPNPPAVLATHKGQIYWTNPVDGVVVRCTAAMCASSLTIVAHGLAWPTGIAVDDSGVYWTERSSGASVCTATSGRITTCPLAGCPATPVVLSNGDACPVAITTTARAVVWANEGEAGQTTGAVRAVAKP